MRIGISTSVIQRGRSGIGQHLFALLRAMLLHPQNHQFTLFVLEEDIPLFEFARERVTMVSVPERFRPPVNNILWHQRVLPSLARRHLLDVLHVPSYRRLLWPRPCPLVGTIHDLAPFFVRRKYDWKRMLYGRVVARQLARRQDEIIAVSRNTANDVERLFGIHGERVTVVYNGIDHDRFRPGDREASGKLAAQRYSLRAPFLLYVARLEHPGKNHARLISAFNAFKSAARSKWQLALGGSDWHGAEVIREAARCSPFRSDIRFLGFVPDEHLPDLYRAAEALVYPSLYEGFGMPPTEAMACGCPVISSARGSLGEIVGDAAMVVDPDDISSIARALSAIAQDPGLRARLRDVGIERARQFDWKVAAARTIRVYERAVARVASVRSKSPAGGIEHAKRAVAID
ncbi:MAG TPA: glycosyltransferase family 4 protein [Verrucomicrobia bacterium]|nr:glycosyltransferase family 4 protein [Verrucomicrobiota bacterium]